MRRRPDPAARCRGAASALFTIALAVAALLMTAMAVTAPVASAHTTRIATDPADGAELATGPARVSATFNQPLQPAFATMTVVGPDGDLWSTGDPQVQGAVVSVGVTPLGSVGSYTVNYRVTSGDGHPVQGSWSFRLTAPGTGTPEPSTAEPQPPAPGGIPVWPFLAGGGVLIAGAAVWLALRAKRR